VSELRVPTIEPVLSASQALQLIADAGASLSSSLDYAQTLRRVAGLAVPALADWCGVYLLGEPGAELEITSGYADPELDAVLSEIRSDRRGRGDASESRRVAQSGEPILAPDTRAALDGDLDERQRRLVSRLGPRSYMLVPLIARGRSLGSLTLLSTREGRHYGEADLAFAQTLAARCAVAIDNARLHDAAERSLSLLDTIFATAPIGLAFVDRDLRFVRVNATMAAFNHRSVEELVGRSVPELLGGRSAALVELYREVLKSGRPSHDHEFAVAPVGAPDDPRYWSVSFTPVHGPDGDLLGISAVMLDVTERHRLLDVEREARARADFLASAGALLEESLDYERTLRAVVEIAVPAVADWCAVSILDEHGALRQVAVAHRNTEQRRRGEELNRRFPADPRGETGTAAVARTGRTAFVPRSPTRCSPPGSTTRSSSRSCGGWGCGR
jgi:PAS domain S-box-containing protein